MNESDTPTKSARKPHQWALLLLGPLVLVIILRMLDLDALWQTLRDVDLELFVAAGLVLCTTVFVRTWRWRLLLAEVTEKTPPFFDLMMIFAYATFVGVATPGRIGEFVKAFHLRNYGVSMGAAAANVLTDRLLDVIALLVIALVSFLVIAVPGAEGTVIVPLIVLAIVLAVVGAWWFVRSPLFDRLVSAAHGVQVGPLQKILGRLEQVGKDFRTAIKDQSVGTLLVSATLTVFAWAIVYGANWMIARSIGLDLTYVQVVAASSVSSLAAQLPVTVLGVGTREATVILILSRYGVGKEGAVALSALFLASILFVAFACAFSMFSRPVRFVRTATEAVEASE